MQIYKVNIPNEVIEEIEYYVDVIAKDSIDAALKWYQGIETAIYTLDQNPERYPVAFEDRFHDYEIRNLIVGNYRVLYRIENKIVQILHVKHGKMERKPLH